MNKNEDIAWVTRCALFDDRRAFACLVDKYQVRLKRFFLNLTGGDPVLSDDLAQETFIKVYYNLRSYKGLSSFSTWIYRVAYNVFYDELRKSREWEDASVDEAANLLEQPPECVDRNIDVSRALSILRPEERTAITLFFVEELETVFGYVERLGIALAVELDLSLARGLNYYTGAIFEVKANDYAIGSICGGGRYDDLTGIFGMPDTSGVGISFGADRIYDVMVGLELFPEEVNFSTKVLFVNLGADEEAASLGLLRALRDAGFAAEIYPEKGKMKKQMEYANRRSIPYVAIVGSDELARQTVTLKDMRTGEQRQVPFAELAASLQ